MTYSEARSQYAEIFPVLGDSSLGEWDLNPGASVGQPLAKLDIGEQEINGATVNFSFVIHVSSTYATFDLVSKSHANGKLRSRSVTLGSAAEITLQDAMVDIEATKRAAANQLFF